MAIVLKKTTLTLVIVVTSIIVISAMIVTTVLILNGRGSVGLQKNAASSFQSCSSIDIPNSVTKNQLPPELTLLNNSTDTVNASPITVHGDPNSSYRVFYAEYAGKSGTPNWQDGLLSLNISSSGTAQYTPTIPQPHASYFNPNAYSYMYSFIKQDSAGSYTNFATTSSGFTTPDKSDTSSNNCIAWLYVNRVQCSIAMHKVSDGSLVQNNGIIDGSDKLSLSINWSDTAGTSYTMPASTDPKSLYFTWAYKINAGANANIWNDYGFDKSSTSTSDMNFGENQTFTKSEYTLNVYGADNTQYRIGPDLTTGYNQPKCYGVVNVSRNSIASPTPTTVATTIATTTTTIAATTIATTPMTTTDTSIILTTSPNTITTTSSAALIITTTPIISTVPTISTVKNLPNTGVFEDIIFPTMIGIICIILAYAAFKVTGKNKDY